MTTEAEREAKFALAPGAALPDLDGLADEAVVTAANDVRLRAVYFDTPDLRLLRRGITLRHRQAVAGGDENSWTLKLPGERDKATFERTEISWPGHLWVVPDEAARLVGPITGGGELAGVAEVETVRRRFELHDHEGRRLAEVADDDVAVTVPTVTRFRQIEVELDGGDEAFLGGVAAWLASAGATRESDEPKVRRALASRLEEQDPLAAVPLGPASCLGDVVRASLASGLARLVDHDIGVRLDQGPEFVHQARVATRRLRSDLKTFRDLLDPGWVREVRAELRWLGSCLGDVRDNDVLAAELGRLAGVVDAAGLAWLVGQLADQRAVAYGRLLDAFGSDRYLALLRRLEAAASEPPLADPVAARRPARRDLESFVRRPWHKLRRLVAGLDSRPSDDDLHRVRIRAKQLRYAGEAVAPVAGKPARRLAAAAEALQTVLGDHHDAVTAERWLHEVAAAGTTSSAFAAGQCALAERQRQARGRDQWSVAWRSLRRGDLRRWTR